jgi:hypothetical protein
VGDADTISSNLDRASREISGANLIKIQIEQENRIQPQ